MTDTKGHHSNDHKHASDAQPDLSKLPITKDTSVQLGGSTNPPEIETVKAVFRPPELLSQPVKSEWTLIWTIFITTAVIVIIYLYWFYSTYELPPTAAIMLF